MGYDESYYQDNVQDGGRPALWMYERLWRRYLGKGPVLEFGCGLGYFARRLAQHTEVYGLETNSFALPQLWETAPEMRLVTTTLNLPEFSFGSVTALHVFEHIPGDYLAQIGAEFSRDFFSPGGHILTVTPDLDSRTHALKRSSLSAFSDPMDINLKGADERRRFFKEQWNLNVGAWFANGYYDFPNCSYRVQSSETGDAFRAIRTLIQFLAAQPMLRHDDGENLVFILERRS